MDCNIISSNNIINFNKDPPLAVYYRVLLLIFKFIYGR